jgi:hypothetical protein
MGLAVPYTGIIADSWAYPQDIHRLKSYPQDIHNSSTGNKAVDKYCNLVVDKINVN